MKVPFIILTSINPEKKREKICVNPNYIIRMREIEIEDMPSRSEMSIGNITGTRIYLPDDEYIQVEETIDEIARFI